ncbi:putative lipoprotein [Spiroplasma kunkelii CR2-3x]|uniref:Putative lipoprotein n=1 Tax=Spiroplasma kunkelii CR2-3x TaxID=273035 RepID=A0A0K2JHN6_SPIKU|nr:lipoprotein [Spiroplasma kunkelii]ALA98110.1 putative lipoprotein [Spiroplasma kunkelii CR2-3x]
MKRLLSLFGAITLLGTSTTSLVGCSKKQEYTPEELTQLKEKNKINTTDENIKNNLEWIGPQEKPFNEVDSKYYYVVWHSNSTENWRVTKFKNDIEIKNGKRVIINENGIEKLFIFMETEGTFKYEAVKYPKDITIFWNGSFNWKFCEPSSEKVFKAVYRWNGEEQNVPDLVIDDDGNIKVKGE